MPLENKLTRSPLLYRILVFFIVISLILALLSGIAYTVFISRNYFSNLFYKFDAHDVLQKSCEDLDSEFTISESYYISFYDCKPKINFINQKRF